MPPERLALLFSTLCFLGAFAVAVGQVLAGPWRSTWWHRGLLLLGFFGQWWVMYIRAGLLHRCPITNLWEVLVFISWGIMLAYWIIGPAYRLSLLGLFTAPMVWLFQMTALVIQGLLTPKAPSSAVLTGQVDYWLEWHATLSLLSYAVFALGATAGVMYLLQDRQLKRRHLGGYLSNLPPLQNLGKTQLRLLIAGFILLTAGVACAYLMNVRPTGSKLAVAWFVWAAYLILIGLILFRHWSGRKTAWGAALIFLLPVVTLWIVSGK
jgi:HemX protein